MEHTRFLTMCLFAEFLTLIFPRGPAKDPPNTHSSIPCFHWFHTAFDYFKIQLRRTTHSRCIQTGFQSFPKGFKLISNRHSNTNMFVGCIIQKHISLKDTPANPPNMLWNVVESKVVHTNTTSELWARESDKITRTSETKPMEAVPGPENYEQSINTSKLKITVQKITTLISCMSMEYCMLFGIRGRPSEAIGESFITLVSHDCTRS